MTLLLSVLFAVLVLLSLGSVVTPQYLVSLARGAQTQADLELAHRLTQAVPYLTLLLLALGGVAAVMLWRRSSRVFTKILLVLGCGVLAVTAYASRLMMVEQIFSPLDEVERVSVADATYVLPNDLVLSVSHADQTTAYPVPIVAYHHIVNDRLADEPFVVTY